MWLLPPQFLFLYHYLLLAFKIASFFLYCSIRQVEKINYFVCSLEKIVNGLGISIIFSSVRDIA